MVKLACPPDDCGGIPGFYDLVEAIADPNHEQHKELRDWLGYDFDPMAFSIDSVNQMLLPESSSRQSPQEINQVSSTTQACRKHTVFRIARFTISHPPKTLRTPSSRLFIGEERDTPGAPTPNATRPSHREGLAVTTNQKTYATTSNRPSTRAVPLMLLIAVSTEAAFKSGIFCVAISRTCFLRHLADLFLVRRAGALGNASRLASAESPPEASLVTKLKAAISA